MRRERRNHVGGVDDDDANDDEDIEEDDEEEEESDGFEELFEAGIEEDWKDFAGVDDVIFGGDSVYTADCGASVRLFHLLMEGYFLTIVNTMRIRQISNRSEEPIIRQTSDNSGETSMQEPWWERAGSVLTRMLGGKLAMHTILGICKSAD
ncbi:hypothetical protein MRB53_007626 [Persea americana]|uniref:Uncharacterized protein n=1 Tax=Persea americana TaxID=3435 RepID=A0ACC2MJR5_PERAE|nr:hypothetical protein MRB53_007626 [Persea americana]